MCALLTGALRTGMCALCIGSFRVTGSSKHPLVFVCVLYPCALRTYACTLCNGSFTVTGSFWNTCETKNRVVFQTCCFLFVHAVHWCIWKNSMTPAMRRTIEKCNKFSVNICFSFVMSSYYMLYRSIGWVLWVRSHPPWPRSPFFSHCSLGVFLCGERDEWELSLFICWAI